MRTLPATLLVCALAVVAQAQIPGRYPPGRSPGGTSNPSGQPRQTKPGRDTKTPPALAPTTTTTGMLRRSAGSQFVLEADDHRIITYRTSAKTTVQREDKDADIASFAIGDRLDVDSVEDDRGYFTAVSVRFEKSGTPADRAAAAETWDLPRLDGAPASAPILREPGDERPILRRKAEDSPKEPAPAAPAAAETTVAKAEPEEPADTRPTTTLRPPDPAPDSDDPGPPALRRGAPAPRRQATRAASTSGGESSNSPVILSKPPENDSPTVSSAVLTPGANDLVIEKARDVAASFSGTLPNFFCQQLTTRYQSDHPKQGWDALDVVTADVAYENGKETYKNIKVGNKAVNKAMQDIEGTRSTGEFASVLEDLLSPATGAAFRRSGQDTVHGRAAWVYKYEVPRERSHWRIDAAAQLYYPAYRGTMWIDRQTSRVLRLEQQSRNMPLLFPFDTVETATEYDFVRLAATEPFLLPVNAEVLSCLRGTSHCSKNKIEFRNYRKFGAESSVTFDDKP